MNFIAKEKHRPKVSSRKIHSMQMDPKKAGVAILIPYKIAFKSRTVKRIIKSKINRKSVNAIEYRKIMEDCLEILEEQA